MLGYTYDRMGRSGEAQAEFEQALALNPDLMVAHSALAYVYAQQGRLQELLKEPPATQSDRAGYETFAALTRSDPTSGGVHNASPVAAFQGLSGLPCAYSR